MLFNSHVGKNYLDLSGSYNNLLENNPITGLAKLKLDRLTNPECFCQSLVV